MIKKSVWPLRHNQMEGDGMRAYRRAYQDISFSGNK